MPFEPFSYEMQKNVTRRMKCVAKPGYQGPTRFNFVIQCQLDYNKLPLSSLFLILLTRPASLFVVPTGIFQKLDLIKAIYYLQRV